MKYSNNDFNRTHVLHLTVIAFVLFAATTSHAQGLEAEPILLALEENEESLAALNISIESRYSSKLNGAYFKKMEGILVEDKADTLRKTTSIRWDIRNDNSRRYEASTSKSNIRSENGTTLYVPKAEASFSVFDAARGQGRQVNIKRLSDGSVGTKDEHTSVFSAEQPSPIELITEIAGTLASEFLRANRATVVEEQQWEGRPVVVLQTEPKTSHPLRFYGQVWVDAERKVLVRQKLFGQQDADHPQELIKQIDYEDFERGAPSAHWLPHSVHIWEYVPPTGNGQGPILKEEHFEFDRWDLNTDLSDALFSLDFTVEVVPNGDDPK